MDYGIVASVITYSCIGILFIGALSGLLDGRFSAKYISLGYITCMLILESTSVYLGRFHDIKTNLILYELGAFVHFGCFTLLLEKRFRALPRSIAIVSIFLASLVLLLGATTYEINGNFHSYAALLFNCGILFFLIRLIFLHIRRGTYFNKSESFFVFALLSYVALDVVVSLTFNYLVNNYLDLVAPLWIVRAGLILLFYVSLINYSWQIGRIRER